MSLRGKDQGPGFPEIFHHHRTLCHANPADIFHIAAGVFEFRFQGALTKNHKFETGRCAQLFPGPDQCPDSFLFTDSPHKKVERFSVPVRTPPLRPFNESITKLSFTFRLSRGIPPTINLFMAISVTQIKASTFFFDVSFLRWYSIMWATTAV